MIWVLADETGRIINIIEYDGVSPYAPPYGALHQVSNTLKIGDQISQEGP